ncbi:MULTISPECIES: leucine-rich repeat protein [unclassified Acinetobacter]|uniref:leucine-rich repeat protein n=1 Tax=unclassified Acinetobacter TaxID=196816 RepID=UPI0015D119FA|nr:MULTISPECIES: leucine-rich repeat protein [unclassified Acinetobacter]
MAIYTGIADANGDFTVPFLSNYTGGQKVTVTAEKDAAIKTIELFAPSDTTGGGVIQFSGNINNFPLNIGEITISGLSGIIQDSSFDATTSFGNTNMFSKAKGLELIGGISSVSSNAFRNWIESLFLILPDSIESIGVRSFLGWSKATTLKLPSSLKTVNQLGFSGWEELLVLDLPETLLTCGPSAFYGLTACHTLICRATTPPEIQSTTFEGLDASCIIKVPAGSVAAYQAAAKWSVFAARIQAI